MTEYEEIDKGLYPDGESPSNSGPSSPLKEDLDAPLPDTLSAALKAVAKGSKDCTNEYKNCMLRAKTEIRSNQALSSGQAKPHINPIAKIAFLPDFIEDDPMSILLGGIVSSLEDQNYRIFYLPYSGPMKSLSDQQEKTLTGMGLFYLDKDQKFKVRNRNLENYEYGRVLARAIMVRKIFIKTQGLSLGALKRDNFWFGNNPDESEVINRVSIPVLYQIPNIKNLMTRIDWADELYSIVISVIGDTASLMGKDAFNYSIEKHLLSKSEVVRYYCTQEVREELRKGKTKIRLVVNKKPGASPLLSKKENDFIFYFFSFLFEDGYPTRKDLWADIILKNTWEVVRDYLKQIHRDRGDFLRKYAKMTTRRLQELRKLTGEPTMKKKDVTAEHVDIFLTVRPSCLNDFAAEVLALAQKDRSYIDQKMGCGIRGVSDQNRLALIIDFIKTQGVYVDKKKIVPVNPSKEDMDKFELDRKKDINHLLERIKKNKDTKVKPLSVFEKELYVSKIISKEESPENVYNILKRRGCRDFAKALDNAQDKLQLTGSERIDWREIEKLITKREEKMSSQKKTSD